MVPKATVPRHIQSNKAPKQPKDLSEDPSKTRTLEKQKWEVYAWCLCDRRDYNKGAGQ